MSTLAHSKCLSRRLKWVFATFFIRRKHRAFRVLFLPFLFFYPNRAWIGSSLTLLLLVGGIYLSTRGLQVLSQNFATPTENLPQALFFGFAAAMLGISGFESSANFVEEQAGGVFPKTLRNMWIAVSVFNPSMALLALALVPIDSVGAHREDLLAHMGDLAGGRWLGLVISVDATLVLSGAVLTSFVGVTGLVKRMTLDRVLPQFLLHSNRRGTAHRIIIAFFLLSVSVLLITKGDIGALAGVYTISFLAVMALFGVGNILLKVRRARLPRPSEAGWPAVLVGIVAVLVGLVGNIVNEPGLLSGFSRLFHTRGGGDHDHARAHLGPPGVPLFRATDP